MHERTNNPQADLKRKINEFISSILSLKESNNEIVLPSILQPTWLKVIVFLLLCGGTFYAFYALTSVSLSLSITLAVTSTCGGLGFLLGLAAMVIWLRDKYKNSHDTFDKLLVHLPNKARAFFREFDKLLFYISDVSQQDDLPVDLSNEVQLGINNRKSLSLDQIQALFEKLASHYNILVANQTSQESSYATANEEILNIVEHATPHQSPPQVLEMISPINRRSVAYQASTSAEVYQEDSNRTEIPNLVG